MVKQRVDQQAFREAVLTGYRTRCAVRRLRHTALLDAAHIVPHPEGGQAVVPNGSSMCKIHHVASDADTLGIRPDLVLESRDDILDEVNGPKLRHGLQEMHGATILVPSRPQLRPSYPALEQRYARFQSA